MAESEKSHLSADGQCDAMSTEAPGQVLCGASSHPPGADKVHSPAHVLWKQLVDFSS